MIERIDQSRLAHARKTCDFLISRVWDDGRFHPIEGQWPESSGYQGECAGTLALAGKVLNDDRYVLASRKMFERFLNERVEGLWSVDYWHDFPVKEEFPADAYDQNKVPESRYTPAILMSLGVYHQVSGDDSVVEPAREAMNLMFERWDYESGDWLHLTKEFVVLAVAAWQHALPEFSHRKDSLIEWVAETFVDHAPEEFPFVTGARTMMLLATTGTKHLETAIRPGIDALLAEPKRRFDQSTSDFRHTPAHTFATGDDHVDTRGNSAVAIMMKVHDVAAQQHVYTNTDLYSYLSGWIDGMAIPTGGWHESVYLGTGEKYGQGSPGHMIPLWWIFGGLTP
jgi:hypothetical protein